MKCENCAHEILEPIISEYCTNCGRPTGISKQKIARIAPSVSAGEAKFVIREWNSAFFPVVASIIPVLVLSYFAAGTITAVVLTFIDFALAFSLYLRSPTFQFFDHRLRIFEGGRLTKLIEYSEIEKISSPTVGSADRYEGSFIISIMGGPVRDIEIPSNPLNSELRVDLITWLSTKTGAAGNLPSTE